MREITLLREQISAQFNDKQVEDVTIDQETGSVFAKVGGDDSIRCGHVEDFAEDRDVIHIPRPISDRVRMNSKYVLEIKSLLKSHVPLKPTTAVRFTDGGLLGVVVNKLSNTMYPFTGTELKKITETFDPILLAKPQVNAISPTIRGYSSRHVIDTDGNLSEQILVKDHCGINWINVNGCVIVKV
ncbi:hypothetical protein [Vibrio mediterranei]|uniref:hypothetical protein n=1 Tax=Vibrio mediterranei TaxID=689 RepID=UPI004067D0F0